ncbi:MAG: competence protein CoiA family protein [Paenibacillaceae bacterium]
MLRSRTLEGEDFYANNCDEIKARQMTKASKLVCPSCKNLVRFKKGDKVSAHFAHISHINCVVTYYERETESHIAGKQLIFNWLKQKYPDAHVELEVYLPETQQIADIFVNHLKGDLIGLNWAFEFQHSPLSAANWRLRHELYRGSGIHDFWIMDAAIFLKYSKSDEQARLFREPVDSIYNETGLCYFLNIHTSVVTIDCKFITTNKKISISGRRTPVINEYTYHSPLQNSVRLDVVEIYNNEKYRFAAMSFPYISEMVNERINNQIYKFERVEEEKYRQKLSDRTKIIHNLCLEQRDNRFANLMSSFILKNRSQVANDLLNMNESPFISKYAHYIEKIDSFLLEYHSLREKEDLDSRIFMEMSPYYSETPQIQEDDEPNTYYSHSRQLYDISFLDAMNNSFADFMEDRYAINIANVHYVLGTYDEELDILMKYNPLLVIKYLQEVNYQIAPKKEVSKSSLAWGYLRFGKTEEIDSLMLQVKEKVIDRLEAPLDFGDDPFE